MDLASAWRSFRQIVHDAQEAVDILHGYLRQQDVNVWQQTRPLDRNDKEELLALLESLESSLSEQNTAAILQGLRSMLPADRESDIGTYLDRLHDVVRGFADDLTRDVADGSLEFRVCPRYLRLREVLDPLTLLEDGYSTSRTLEQALARQTHGDSTDAHGDQTDAILAKKAEEEAQRRERKDLEIEANNRCVEMVNAFTAIPNLTREGFHKRTGEDPHHNDFPRNVPDPPETYWTWQAGEIVKACQSLHGWEGELEEYSPETEAQQVAMELLQAGKSSDRDRIAELLKRMGDGSPFSWDVKKEVTRDIPRVLEGIDRAKRAPKDEPEAPADHQLETPGDGGSQPKGTQDSTDAESGGQEQDAEATIDLTDYQAATELQRQHGDRFPTYKKFKAYLDKHADAIRTYKPSEQRLFVHVADLSRELAKENKQAFEALDAPAGVVDAIVQETERRKRTIRKRKKRGK